MAKGAGGGGRGGRTGGGSSNPDFNEGYQAALNDPILANIIRRSGPFVLSAAVSRIAYGDNPKDIGLNRFTGKRDIAAAQKEARRIYENVARELGARKALGETGLPSLSAVRSGINRLLGL